MLFAVVVLLKLCRIKMDYISNYLTPLAIRRYRDEVHAMGDILELVSKSSGRDKQDLINANEARHLRAVWKALNSGDRVLFERNAATAVVYSVFHLQQ